MSRNLSPENRPGSAQGQVVVTIATVCLSLGSLPLFAVLIWPEILFMRNHAVAALLLSAATWFLAVFVSRRIRRAYYVQLFFCIVFLISQLGLWIAGIGLAQVALGARSWIMIVAAFASSIVGFIVNYYALGNSNEIRDYSLSRGRLNLARATWDLRASRQTLIDPTDGPTQKPVRIQVARWIAAFAPIVGRLIVEDGYEWLVLHSFVAFFLAYGLVMLMAFALTIATEIKNIEREIGKPLMLPENG